MFLYNDDCLNVMANIAEGSVNCIITDPPYKLNKTTGSSTNSSKASSWQGNLKAGDKTANIENEIKFSEWLPLAYKILKDGGHLYIWVNDKNLSDLQVAAEKVGFKLHNILVWQKNNCTPNRWYMKNCEFILFMRKGKSVPIHNLGDTQLYACKNLSGKDKLHPTQKPVEYIERLLLNSTKEGDLVLDMFMGSGSTGVACKKLNRNFIGIEKDEYYFQIAERRLYND